MRKKIFDDFLTKAKKREQKKRPRMALHGSALKNPQPHGGRKLAKQY